MLGGSKLKSKGSKISEALINNEISHEDFSKITNEEKNYRELKEIISMKKSQRSDTRKIISMKKAKEWVLMKLFDKII